MIARLSALSLCFLAIVLATCPLSAQSDETTLYDSTGKPTAYISDDLTIYLWSGKPVAYLSSGRSGTDVYGFNGKHLGWFEKGYIRTNEGDAACGVKAVIHLPELEPFKSFKEFKPFKSFKEFAPMKPVMSRSWSDTPCQIALALGTAD